MHFQHLAIELTVEIVDAVDKSIEWVSARREWQSLIGLEPIEIICHSSAAEGGVGHSIGSSIYLNATHFAGYMPGLEESAGDHDTGGLAGMHGIGNQAARTHKIALFGLVKHL